MKEREERSLNIVFYGMEESKEVQLEAKMKEEKEKVGEVIRCIGVEVKEDLEIKFRSGRSETPSPDCANQ